MKRHRIEINEETITEELCQRVILEAARGKKGKEHVRKVIENLEYYAKEIRDIVINDKFIATPYRRRTIFEKGKERELTIPKFYPDQVVHHLVISLMKDSLMKMIDPYSAASLPGRGRYFMVENAARFLVKRAPKCKYVLKADIKKCYPSLKKEYIYAAIERHYKGDKFLKIVKEILWQSDTLSIGNYTSGYFLNLVLLPMDQEIRSFIKIRRGERQKQVQFYARYMDDMIVFSQNKRSLNRIKERIETFLSSIEMKLKFGYVLPTENNFDVIGFTMRLEKKDKMYLNKQRHSGYILHIGLRKKTFKAIKNLCIKISKMKRIDSATAKSFLSTLSALSHFNSKIMYDKYITELKIDLDKIKHIAYGDTYKAKGNTFEKQFKRNKKPKYKRVDHKHMKDTEYENKPKENNKKKNKPKKPIQKVDETPTTPTIEDTSTYYDPKKYLFSGLGFKK